MQTRRTRARGRGVVPLPCEYRAYGLTIASEVKAAVALKVAFVTQYDARDVRAWSGLPYHMLRAFERLGVEVTLVGPLSGRGSRGSMARKAAARIQRRTYLQDRDPVLLRSYAAQVSSALREIDCDLIL